MKDLTRRHRGAEKIVVLVSLCFCVSALNVLPPGNAAPRPNVLILSIDTLRADHLGCYGYNTKTPAIDSLASGSILFENTISQVPLTLPSHSSIFTGLYPDQHGVRNNENFVLPEKTRTIAELFRDQGYSTGAVVGSFSLDSSFGIDQGFQFYEDKIGQGHDPEINRHVERRAESVWKIGRDWLQRQKGPWFAFFHFFDPHFPYNPPAGNQQTYDGEIAYTDRIVGTIVEFLKEKKWLDSTIVILLSDHGESLGEHGEDNHGIFVYDATVRVPFLTRIPGHKPQRVAQQVRLVDVAPTIVDLAGLKPQGFAGETLVPFLNGVKKELPAYSESYYANLLMGWAPLRSIRWNQKKWIDAPKPELYDLSSDPKELKNIYTQSAVPAQSRTELRRHDRKETPVTEKVVDPEIQEKLASLGYVTGASNRPVASQYDPKDGIGLWTEMEAAVRDSQLSRWSAAEKRFSYVLQKQPDNVIAQKFLANVLRKQGKQDSAIVLLQRALQSPLHQTETRTHLAEAFLEKKDYPRALEQVSVVLRVEPQNMRALTMAAWLQFHLKKDQDAIQTYSKLATIRSLTEEEALQAAAIHLTAGKKSDAEKYFRLAIAANPTSTVAWTGIGLILASNQQWEAAADGFLKAGDCENIHRMLQRTKLSPTFMEAIRTKCPE